METLIGFLILIGVPLFGVILLALLWHWAKLRKLQAAVDRLTQRLARLEATGVVPAPAAPPGAPRAAAPAPVVAAPPMPAVTVATPPAPQIATPPPLPIPASASAPVASRPAKPAIDWEAFFGVKLFGWLGGFVLFLGVVFAVTYSFQNNLITPTMRVVGGVVVGLVLVAAGWITARRNYRAPGQSLCATGVLVLYASIFGAYSFYGLIPLWLAFALMSVVTVAAFFLAVRLDAPVVVVLGLIGGFLTPPLLMRGPDDPLLLFGYVALLNFGIAAVVLRKKWDYLLLLAAFFTALTEIGWLLSNDAAGMAVGFLVFLAMQALFLLFAWLRQRQAPTEKWSTPAALGVGAASFVFAFWLLFREQFALRPGFFFGFTFLADIGLLALALLRPNPSRIAAAAGTATFLILSAWTGWYLTDDSLYWALGAYVLFAIVHAGFSVWPPRAEGKVLDTSWRVVVPLFRTRAPVPLRLERTDVVCRLVRGPGD